MNTDAAFTRCLSFINCQLNPAHVPGEAFWPRRGITISRLAGAGGHELAEELVKELRRRAPQEDSDWAIFDKNLVEKVLEDHHLPGRLAKFMPEDRISGLSDTMDELFGLHPPSFTLIRQTSDTIYRLAEMGNVIIIGRGANLVTARLKHMFHVRLVGSFEKRVEYVMRTRSLDRATAERVIRAEDLGRKRYVQKYFSRDIDDALAYNMIINTDAIRPATAARLIADAMAALPQGRDHPEQSNALAGHQ